jgi:hypothetical protein
LKGEVIIVSEEWSLKKALEREGLVALLIEGVKWIVTWLSPWAITVATIVAGYAQSVSVPWVATISAGAFVFAASTTGMLRYDEWWQRRTPRDKLSVQALLAAWEYARDTETGRATHILRTQMSIILQNAAHFPISYTVEEITSSAEGRINSKPQYQTKGGALILAVLSGFAMTQSTFRVRR